MRPIQGLPIAVDFQVFRVAVVTLLEHHSAALTPTGTGGVLQRPALQAPGSATYTTTLSLCTEVTTLRVWGFRFVALGIRTSHTNHLLKAEGSVILFHEKEFRESKNV